VNNRNPNKENTYSNLAAWCEKYHKDSGIKIHPSSVPVDLVLEDIMGIVAHLRSNINMLIGSLDNAFNRLDEQQSVIETIKTRHDILFDRFVDLETRVDSILLNAASEVVKETKKAKK
jgi:hypothetical protein